MRINITFLSVAVFFIFGMIKVTNNLLDSDFNKVGENITQREYLYTYNTRKFSKIMGFNINQAVAVYGEPVLRKIIYKNGRQVYNKSVFSQNFLKSHVAYNNVNLEELTWKRDDGSYVSVLYEVMSAASVPVSFVTSMALEKVKM